LSLEQKLVWVYRGTKHLLLIRDFYTLANANRYLVVSASRMQRETRLDSIVLWNVSVFVMRRCCQRLQLPLATAVKSIKATCHMTCSKCVAVWKSNVKPVMIPPMRATAAGAHLHFFFFPFVTLFNISFLTSLGTPRHPLFKRTVHGGFGASWDSLPPRRPHHCPPNHLVSSIPLMHHPPPHSFNVSSQTDGWMTRLTLSCCFISPVCSKWLEGPTSLWRSGCQRAHTRARACVCVCVSNMHTPMVSAGM
jgi:hypothetical protein